MFKTLANAWKLPDLRKKLIFTLCMLAIFQVGTVIPVPGLDPAKLKELLGMGSEAGGGIFDLLNIISGGSLGNASIFALSITPYVTASIIIQLLAVAIPALERISREDGGREIIAKWTRYSTVILAFIQSASLYVGFSGLVDSNSPLNFFIVVVSLTAGTAFLMWLGEQITDKGIGNGISIIIFAGIVANLPTTVQQFGAIVMQNGSVNIVSLILIVLIVLAVVTFVVFINDAERRIPVQYAKRVVGRKMYGGQSSNIPFKVAMAGVIPIIFASSLLSFPQTMVQLFTGNSTATGFWGKVLSVLNYGGPVYMVLYFILIIFFSFFYTAMIYNPIEMSNNIKRNGGFVPGIRPGRPTTDYITKVMNRVTTVGSVCIALIAVVPLLFAKSLGVTLSFSGTSLLILVGVAIETYRQLESQLLMRHYKSFLD
ncbi:MAG: preprotein translocase subunit SecY [Clostridia bacterium]|nr:preprotein translocase subunit SecY [Clostridia bacterium]